MAEIPHFDLPFRYSGGRPAVNEQGSLEDIAASVTAVCLVRPGDLIDQPDFGLPDPTFEQEPVSTGNILGPVGQWVPDAHVLAQLAPSALDAAIVNVNLKVEG